MWNIRNSTDLLDHGINQDQGEARGAAGGNLCLGFGAAGEKKEWASDLLEQVSPLPTKLLGTRNSALLGW
jgi:hypothetical protein